jgi:hypothetical protein
MLDMYPVSQLLTQRTYPFDAPRLSTGFALTARHFFQTPKKYPKRLAPAYGPRFAQVSLVPVPLRGHAVTGHPWPITALPASMPGDPLRRTSTRPPEGAGRSKAMPAEAADRPACLAARSARLAHLLCGSGLARDASGAVFELNRADAIASKPAPTWGCAVSSFNLCFGCSHAINQATRMPLTGG